MAIKQSELYRSLWASCDELRGGMDPSQYKDYILVLLFVKYVSDKHGNDPDATILVPEGGSFKDMVALKGKSDIGNQMNMIIGALAEENDLKGVIDVADFADDDKLGKGKEMVDKLSNLIRIFENPALDFSKNRAGAYLRTKVTPVNPSTTDQASVRALFGAITQGWSALAAASIALWNAAVSDWATTDIFGDLKNPSGKNLYQRLNQVAQLYGYSALTTPPAKVAMPEDIVTAVAIDITAGDLSLTGAVSDANFKIVLSGTPMLSAGTSFVKNKLRGFDHQVSSTFNDANAYAAYVAKFGAPTAGSNVHIAVQYVTSTGQITPMQILKATVTA